ncbi:hypothetical protein RHS04_04394 [Rhizoctonia solani]|uniref:C2H2-type domain-containing protein n=1 Tax=Rhizoctonia solani TaxID=456999 RepID=A0A8H7HA24_9AGAM|nr:hypothetical protein RHS04_04394 [Rhizoctonia solani]
MGHSGIAGRFKPASPPGSLPPTSTLSSKCSINKPSPKGNFVCKECGNDKWTNQSALSRHERTHKDNKDRQYQCTLCPMGFTQKTALSTHFNTHSGARPHRCRAGCDRSFSDPSSRGRHENEIHNPAHGFKCLRPGCNESFKRKGMFGDHMVNAHAWPNKESISPAVFTAAKAKCAEDYRAANGNQTASSNISNQNAGANTSDFDDDGSLAAPVKRSNFNRKHLRSDSTSSDDFKPPPTKKHLSRRNAVASITSFSPQDADNTRLGHQRSGPDDRGITTTTTTTTTTKNNPIADAFLSCYQPGPHAASPYTDAISRVQNNSTSPAHSVIGEYSTAQLGGATPNTVSNAASYESSSENSVLPETHWPTTSYEHPWPLENDMLRASHGTDVKSVYTRAREDIYQGNTVPQNRLEMFYTTTTSNIYPPIGEYQAKPPSGSSSLNLDYGQAAINAFRDRQVLVRAPSDYSVSSHSDSNSQGMLESNCKPLDGVADRNLHIPRSVTGHGGRLYY